MRKTAVLFLVLLFSVLLGAHEFWIDPDHYQYEVGESIHLRFQVGENYTGENWSGSRNSVRQLKVYQQQWEDDLAGNLGTNAGDSLELSLGEEGTAMFTLETRNRFIWLEAGKFNDYLKEDGLVNVEEFRKRENETDSAGREYYRRSVKTIVQVGDALGNRCTQKTGLPLDIIPSTNPYAPGQKDSLSVKVLFKGQPVAGQLIKLWHKTGPGTTRLENLHTDKSGVLRFPHVKEGSWMVSLVQMERVVADSAQWQSYWGSLTWGYDK